MSTDGAYKAIADPTRRRILRLLSGGEMTAGELAAKFDISAPSMSHHFSVLKGANLVSARREGQQIHYALNTTVLQDLAATLLDLFGDRGGRGSTKQRRRKESR